MSASWFSSLLAVDSATSFRFDADAVLRLTVAALLGAVVGVEREAGGVPAGLRTHMAVASGAALFGAVSTLGFVEFEEVRADTNINVDVTRVASNVVVGIGFLGAGVVFRRGNMVHNLTTAASLWMVAAIGLACGVGDIATAAVATVLLLACLVLLRPLRDHINRRWSRTSRPMEAHLVVGGDPEVMLAHLAQLEGIVVTDTTIEKEGGQIRVRTNLEGPPDRVRAGITSLSKSDQIDTLHEA